MNVAFLAAHKQGLARYFIPSILFHCVRGEFLVMRLGRRRAKQSDWRADDNTSYYLVSESCKTIGNEISIL